MKKSLFICATLIINSSIHGMQKKITLIGDNNQKFTLSAKAAKLSGYINGLLNAQEELTGEHNNEVSCKGMVENNELKNIVHILEKKANLDVSHLTEKENQKKEITDTSAQLIDSIFRPKNYNPELVKKYLIASDKFDIPFFFNILAELFVYARDENDIQQIIEEKLPKSVLHYLGDTFTKYKKNKYSIADYIKTKRKVGDGAGFVSLTRITSLHGIEQLPTATSILSLYDNNITKYGLMFPLKPFKNVPAELAHLTYLMLGSINLKKLSADMFKGLNNLRKLSVQFNWIKIIENGVFSCLKQLEKLELTGNKIQKLTTEILHGLDNLQTLECGLNNKLSKINDNTFQSLTKLTSLNLQRNNLNEQSQAALKNYCNKNKICLEI